VNRRASSFALSRSGSSTEGRSAFMAANADPRCRQDVALAQPREHLAAESLHLVRRYRPACQPGKGQSSRFHHFHLLPKLRKEGYCLGVGQLRSP
jgi:hypothetical protein